MNDMMQKIEKWYPGATNGKRIDELSQRIDQLEAKQLRLRKRIQEIDVSAIYEENVWPPATILKKTKKQIHIKPRWEGDKPIVLNREKLEAEGEYFYRRRWVDYYTGEKMRAILEDERACRVTTIASLVGQRIEMEDNWACHGLAMTHEEMVVAVDVFGFRKTETESNWLKDGF